MLKAGVAHSAITPADGMTMVVRGGREGVAEGKDADLTATLLILQRSGTQVAIAAFDLVFLHGETLPAVRKAIGDALRCLRVTFS